jgi:Tfp pilus assembly protein PilF
MHRRSGRELDQLITDVEWAMAQRFPARDLVPMLENLVKAAPSGSEAAHFAKLQLAELTVMKAPWRAARLARDVLTSGERDRAWAVLALAHTLLGHYRIAARSYRRALALAPECAVYLHNLGHLLDIGLNRPRDAVGYLARAHRGLPEEPEIASSYAHALARLGQLTEARKLLARAVRDPERADRLLAEWREETPIPPG